MKHRQQLTSICVREQSGRQPYSSRNLVCVGQSNLVAAVMNWLSVFVCCIYRVQNLSQPTSMRTFGLPTGCVRYVLLYGHCL